MRKQLTDANVEALSAKRKRYVVYDSTVTSLAVRVSPKGKKTFVVVGRFNGKHPTRRRLGVVGQFTIDQARERALKFNAKPSDKISDVAERYFAHIKQYRRVATRYDKKAANFLGFVWVASLAILLA